MRLRFPALFSAVALALALLCGQARAMQAADPSALISQLVTQAINVIVDKNEPEDRREAKFRSLLQSGFDIPRISRFVLGRYWNAATEDQRKQFSQLFEDWIVRTYSARFGQYSGEKIQVTGTRSEGPTTTVVISQFVSPNGAPPAKVEWVVRKSGNDDYTVVDVSVEGVSMALTQRDEIAAVADRNGGTVDGLNRAMKEKIKGAGAGSGK
ncbi:MAG TPA: ABC transporter substrate-binding protein [Stellaceae bacterium]|jgi:phospholipid transport system substrate-binding protein|nr:ABC transporter substrate-binding protein [Stellaceae bacterium]